MNTISRRHSNQGFSLIELMISITLGLIVIFGVGQVFVATRTSYSSQQGLSGMQQNSRVGIRMMADAVRNGGDMGFNNLSGLMLGKGEVSNTTATVTANNAQQVFQVTNFAVAGADIGEMMRVESGVSVYEYVGSAPGDNFNLPDPQQVGSAGEWSPRLPAPLARRALKNSDVIITRYMDPYTVHSKVVSGSASCVGGACSGDSVCTSDGGFTYGSGETVPASAVAELNARPKRLYALADVRMMTVFQATNISLSGSELILSSTASPGYPGNVLGECAQSDKQSAEGSRIGEVHIEAFYVALNPDTGEPGLWRAAFEGTGEEGFTHEELVEGVENLQITLGVTMPPANPRQGVSTAATDRVITGDKLNDPMTGLGLTESRNVASRRALSVRIAALMRSEAGAAGQVNTEVYRVGLVNVNPADDRRLRQVYENNIGIRNRQRMATGLANFY